MLKIFLCKTKTEQTKKKKSNNFFFLLYGGLVIEPIFSNKMLGKIVQENVRFTAPLENRLLMHVKPSSGEGTQESCKNLILNH